MRCNALSILLLCTATMALGQSNAPFAPKPPAAVDAALRTRVKDFFDLHVKGQFRKAEDLVAEDTKDFFYSRNKPKYLSFEIIRIDYSEKFTKAKVTLMCEQYISAPGFATDPIKVPTPSTWILEKGKWVWWVDQDALLNTPFGRMTPGPFPNRTGGAAAPPMAAMPASADFLFRQIQMDKDAVRLQVGEPVTVVFTSSAPGVMPISIPSPLPLIEASFDQAAIPAGGRSTLTLRALKGAESGVLNVQVEMTQQILPIRITIIP